MCNSELTTGAERVILIEDFKFSDIELLVPYQRISGLDVMVHVYIIWPKTGTVASAHNQ